MEREREREGKLKLGLQRLPHYLGVEMTSRGHRSAKERRNDTNSTTIAFPMALLKQPAVTYGLVRSIEIMVARID